MDCRFINRNLRLTFLCYLTTRISLNFGQIFSMVIRQIYTPCLAQASYFLASDGEAAIFDPLRETQQYITEAQQLNAKVKFVFETHFHADFVSGHLDLAAETGAKIVYGPNAKPAFEAEIANDGQEFYVGKCKILVLHTPGHTLESSCYLIHDETGKATHLITGDTLFIGDVGRPDLAQSPSKDLTTEVLAGMLYDSLRSKILPLPDDLIIFPSHGAGSACGKNMSKETFDTLGHQKQVNYALNPAMTKQDFIAELLDGLAQPPAYFPQNVALNARGYTNLSDVLLKALNPISAKAFKETAEQMDVLILDVRNETDFTKAHIPGSVFIGLNGSFAPWVGAVLQDVNRKLLLVTPVGKEEETVTRLSRVGFDGTVGYLDGGFESWISAGFEIDSIPNISPEDFANQVTADSIVVDSRKPSEYNSGHLLKAINLPLDDINENGSRFPKEKFFIHCAGGYRSVIAASILKKAGNHEAVNISLGMSGIRKTELPIVSREICS